MTARTDAQQRHERTIALVLEQDVDKCANVYGSAPCTAAAGAGNECYNTFATCQDKPNFVRGTTTHKFATRGTLVPGETVRPYISGNAEVTPTEIVPSKGLAMRSQTSIKLLDEPCPDHLDDPYALASPQRTLDTRITFTGSNGTYFDSTGTLRAAAANQPRFDHDPITLAVRGLRVEEARTNLLLNSLLNGTSLGTQSVVVIATPYTLSFYGTGTVTLSGASTAGPLVGTGANNLVTLTFTPTAGSLTLTVSGAVKWANLEAGLTATSFIPTAGTSVTRTADLATMTGANFSSWYNPSEGTFVVEGVIPFVGGAGFPALACADDGTANNALEFAMWDASGDAVKFAVTTGAANQASITAGTYTAGTVLRLASAYKANDFAASYAGAAAVTDATGTVPTVDRLRIGVNRGGGNALNGWVRRITYYATRLTTAELQTLAAGGTISATPALDLNFVKVRAPATGTFWSRLLARNPNLVGRMARVRQGYVQKPWTYDTFQTQLFVLDAVRGPDQGGAVTLVLSDVLKIADRNVLPTATDGALVAELKAVQDTGFAQAGGAATITLRTEASAVDGFYVGMEVYVRDGIGAGQRRVISGYVGATRVATVSVAWAVVPTSSSVYDVGPLSLTLTAEKGAKYPDPATSGKPEYVRVGDEVIRYTARAGDVLSWADTTYRAQWGTVADDHQVKDNVQLCRAWVNKRPWEVLRDIHTESGISATYLDLAAWEVEDNTYLNGAEISAIVTEPEKCTTLIAELLQDLNAIEWYDPVAQLCKLLANQPAISGTPVPLGDDNFVLDSTRVERMDGERITQAALYFNLRSATANRTEAKNYLAAAINIDLDAQSPNEYGDVRPATSRSRWLSAANAAYARQQVARRVARLRDAPVKVQFKVDPKDEVRLGGLVNITTRKLADVTGAPKTTLCRVVRMKDAGAHFDGTALSVGYGRSRYGVIAPNGQPDYGSATELQRAYAYICNASGLMGNGDDGYYIL